MISSTGIEMTPYKRNVGKGKEYNLYLIIENCATDDDIRAIIWDICQRQCCDLLNLAETVCIYKWQNPEATALRKEQEQLMRGLL